MFYDIYLYTLCYCICCLLGACMRYTRLCSLKPGVTEVVSEEMLTVGRNLDRNGQNPSLLTLLWFILYLSHLDLVSPSTFLLWSLLSFLLWDKMDFTPWNPTFMTFLRDRIPKTKLKLFSLLKKCGLIVLMINVWFASLIDWNIIDGHLSMYHHKVMN
jgi:hypothetical protein